MGKTLTQIAQELKDSPKKVQLIYAFNGTGKTRLSREFKELIEAKESENSEELEEYSELSKKKILYYSAFTEDLFYWDNDLRVDEERKLKIHPNSFTNWIFTEQGYEDRIASLFQRYTSDKLNPKFNENFSEVSFSYERGNEDITTDIKISKGEESNFIWSIFYALLVEVINTLNIPEIEDRSTDMFNNIEYIFIDDPVSSLDENHLIELAVDLAQLIKSSDFTNGKGIKFIITTHNVLFYNVLYNELDLKQRGKKDGCYLLKKLEDNTFEMDVKYGDSNKSFSYHLYLKHLIEDAIEKGQIQKYHFTLLRNLYEKTANFLGYSKWSELLPDDKQTYYNRIIQFTSHSTLSNEMVAEPTPPEKNIVTFLFNHLIENYNYWKDRNE